MITDTSFNIATEKYTQAFSGASNLYTLQLKPVGPYLSVELDDNENVDFNANNCTRIDVSIGDNKISSQNSEVTWSKGDVKIEFGAFNIEKGSYNYKVIAYFGDDLSKGTVMCVDGRVNFNKK